jgi:hypothetical protein
MATPPAVTAVWPAVLDKFLPVKMQASRATVSGAGAKLYVVNKIRRSQNDDQLCQQAFVNLVTDVFKNVFYFSDTNYRCVLVVLLIITSNDYRFGLVYGDPVFDDLRLRVVRTIFFCRPFREPFP